MDQIILFGDSITQGSFEPGLDGFGQRLAHAYARKLDVINRGMSGYNAKWAWPVFRQQFPPPGAHVRLLTIWLGANDACIPPSPQCHPIPDFVQSMNQILDHAHATSPGTKIMLLTPPPFSAAYREADLASRSPPLKLDRSFEHTRAYGEAIKELGKARQIPVLDVFRHIWEDAGKSEDKMMEYFTDGLHLNRRGYEIVYREMIGLIQESYSELDPEKMEYIFVPWKDVDWANPEGSLVPRKV